MNFFAFLIACLFLIFNPLYAQSPIEGKTIQLIELFSDGPLTGIGTDSVLELLTLREGAPFQASLAKESIQRLYSTQMFHDVQITAEPTGAEQVQVRVFLVRKYLIQQVRFEGEPRLERRQLRRQMTFRPGEAYSQTHMEGLLARLQELYQRHGYYRPRIEPSFELHREKPRLDLILHIEAGEQARVGQIQWDLQGELAVDSSELRSLIETQEGGPYSRVRLENDLRTLERHLAFNGYLRVSVRETVQHDQDRNTVSVTLHITPRERTLVEFQGVDEETETLLDLPVFRQRGTSQIFLDQTQRELLDRYQRAGYFLATVNYETEQANAHLSRIVFTVQKGQKHDIDEVRFEGNVFAEDGSLKRIVVVEEGGLFGRGQFSREMAESDAQRIRRYYQSRGFRDAEVGYRTVTNNPHSNGMVIVYTIQEGPRYFIDGVQFTGNENIPDQALFDEIEGRANTPFSSAIVAQDRANLIALYENQGYRQVDIRSEISLSESARAQISYFIREGEQFHVQKVMLFGNVNTRPSVIRREIVLSSGTPLSLSQMLQTETNLYDLAVFNKVQVRDVPSYNERLERNVMINTEEAKKYTLLYGFGYSSFEGPRGTLGITNNNFMGTANALSLNLRAGAQRQRAHLSYTMSHPFGRELPTLLTLSGSNEEALTRNVERGREAFRGKPFDEIRLGASVQTERRLSRRESMFFRYNLERVAIDLPRDLAVPLQFFREQELLKLSGLSVSYLNESRNAPSNPTGGFLLSGDARLFSSVIGSDEDFFRFLAQGQYYRRLFPDLVLASALRIGVIAPFGESSPRLDNPVPISERFFSGGATTLRGLPQDLAGPLLRDSDTGEVILVKRDEDTKEITLVSPDDPNARPIPLGGNGLVIANVELRFPIVSFLSGALFFDTGNVFRSVTDLSAGFSNAVGFGIQVNTPVGPIRFDTAYNPNPPDLPGFDRWNFHLSLGQLF